MEFEYSPLYIFLQAFKTIFFSGVVSIPLFWTFLRRMSNQLRAFSTIEIGMMCSALVFFLYNLFFLIIPYFRTFNDSYPFKRYTYQIQKFVGEHDGLEGYVLLLLMLLILSFSFLLYLALFNNSINRNAKKIIILSSVASCIYFLQIGWHPPMEAISNDKAPIFYLIVGLGVVISFLVWLDRLTHKLVFAFVAILLVPISFIAIQPISVFDYSFIWAPGYKILNGYSLDEIYFQYDLLLSLIAAGWMKAGFELRYFQLLGQISFYIFLIICLVFSRNFFLNKKLYIFFFLFLLVVRYYAIMVDPTCVFQVTPLRLDLWIILLLIVYYKGTKHWLLAATLGILIMVHRNFGLLYLASYIELNVLIITMDFLESKRNSNSGINFEYIKSFLLKQFKDYSLSISILLFFILLTVLLFNGLVPTSALLYQKIGIGMIPVSEISFYWYIPLLISVTFILLLKNKVKLGDRYFQTACFLIFLAVSNSMYFFGRSHEHNIINIAGVLVFVLFIFIDLLFLNQGINLKNSGQNEMRISSSVRFLRFKRHVIYGYLILALCMASYYYSDRIITRIQSQYAMLVSVEFAHNYVDIESDLQDRLRTVQELTNNSDDVFFFDGYNDFMYTYLGKYDPPAYFFPCAAWIFRDDMFNYFQTLLDDGYFLVVDSETFNEYSGNKYIGIESLDFTIDNEKEGFHILKKK